MASYFIFNGKSSKEFPIIVNKLPPIQSPKRKVEVFESEGIDGNLVVDYETYEPFVYSIEFTFMSSDMKTMRMVNSWLSCEGKLTLSDELDKYYYARVCNSISYEKIKTFGIRKAIVQFECQPFAYEYHVTSMEIVQDAIVYNSTNANSLPEITVYGTGECRLSINNNEVILKDVEEHITLDCELEEAHKNGEGKNNKMVGEFPKLLPGENEITLSNNIEKLVLQPRWRWR